jgi:hypothetical protein
MSCPTAFTAFVTMGCSPMVTAPRSSTDVAPRSSDRPAPKARAPPSKPARSIRRRVRRERTRVARPGSAPTAAASCGASAKSHRQHQTVTGGTHHDSNEVHPKSSIRFPRARIGRSHDHATGPRRRATNGMAISRAPETTPRRWRGDLESQSRARRYGPEPRAAQTQATLRRLRHRAFPIAANDPAPSFNPASMTSALRRVISIATRTSQKPPDSPQGANQIQG